MPPPSPAGILNIDKPQGWTSHDVVAKARRLTGQRRIGHAGTLDPLATGVLLLCVGQATRLVQYLMPGQKRYRTTVRMGIVTDTYDSTGVVISQTDRIDISRPQIEAVLPDFTGEIEQVPPMFSALKRDGQPLYKLARRGETVEREARSVRIESLSIFGWTSPDLTLDILCTSGTYVRSLAHDLGLRLGCGGHVTALTRLASGRFLLAEAVSLETLAAAAEAGTWADYLHPMDAALLHLHPIAADESETKRLLNGQPIPCLEAPSTAEGRAYDPGGRLIAIVVYDAGTAHWRPKRVFSSI
ncbi:MAG TPA: tRNA pseudouridine(55) synthase TruB [Anaerolineae bacterium]|nr:tRNA pseudouridine(55) synthase TruB [Anaerolineae bacterium]